MGNGVVLPRAIHQALACLLTAGERGIVLTKPVVNECLVFLDLRNNTSAAVSCAAAFRGEMGAALRLAELAFPRCGIAMGRDVRRPDHWRAMVEPSVHLVGTMPTVDRPHPHHALLEALFRARATLMEPNP